MAMTWIVGANGRAASCDHLLSRSGNLVRFACERNAVLQKLEIAKRAADPQGNRRPPIVPISAYFRLAMAVRSNLPVATKVALHQFEPNPPGLIPVKSPENRAVWSLVKALQSPLL